MKRGAHTPAEIGRIPPPLLRALLLALFAALVAWGTQLDVVVSATVAAPPTAGPTPKPAPSPPPLPAPSTTPTPTPTPKPKPKPKRPAWAASCNVKPDRTMFGRINTDHRKPGVKLDDPREDAGFQLAYAGFIKADEGDVDGGLAWMLAGHAEDVKDRFPFHMRDIGNAYAAKNCPRQALPWFKHYRDHPRVAGARGKMERSVERMQSQIRRALPDNEQQSRVLSWSHRVFARCNDAKCVGLADDALAGAGKATTSELASFEAELQRCMSCAH